LVLPGYGGELSFGFQTKPGIYSLIGTGEFCSIEMQSTTAIYFLPEVGLAGAPAGPSEVCNSEKDTEYITSGAINAESYIWQLNPPEAGMVIGNSTTGFVDWNADYSGTAEVLVQGINNCGPGEISPGMQVNVIPAPHPVISGQLSVCNTNTGNVYFYSTPEDLENEYYWTVAGGNIVTGQGTNQVVITWEGEGEGHLTVAESAPSGCTAVADTLVIDINDCTGISEKESFPVTLYPNPASDLIALKCPVEVSSHGILYIYDQRGKTVFRGEIRAGDLKAGITFSLSAFSAGTYNIMILLEDGKVSVERFIKTP
jgi:hypothetical protein